MENYEKLTIGKRYLTGRINLGLVFLFTLFLYLVGGIGIGKKMVGFDQEVLHQKKLTGEIYNHRYDTHLYCKDKDGNAREVDEIFKNYVQNQLAGEMKDADGSYLDPLAYYYISFDKSRSVNEFNHQILLVGNEDSFYEAKDRESLGYLKLEVKEKLSSYFDGKMTDSNKKTYNSFSDFFSKAWFNAVEKEKKGPIITSLVNQFNQSVLLQGLGLGIPALCSYLIVRILFEFILPLSCKQRTRGNLLLHSDIRRKSGNFRPAWWQTLIRFLVNLILDCYIPFYVLALVTGVENACKVPLLKIGSFSLPLATVGFTLTIFALINLFVLSCSKSHQSYADLITATYHAKRVENQTEENTDGRRKAH